MQTRKLPRRTPVPARDSYSFEILACLLFGLTILAVYAQTFDFGFVSYDDDRYVYDNPMVKTGISVPGLIWAVTSFHASNWHPLTWISYMVDENLFGLNAGAAHAVNVLLHFGATCVLFLALLRMTRQKWSSAFVAGVFALHPLHVESVAWIAERKDVLSAFFQMLTLLLYARYAEKPEPRRYLMVALAFALSLLAKPMAVTLPFVLLLLDFWPLRRTEGGPKQLIGEKIPLVAMSLAASVLTVFAQRTTAIMTLAKVPLAERFANAAVAYLSYIGKAFWPVGLAVLYPIHQPPALAVFAAVLILSAVTVSAVLALRRRPYWMVGWFWYLGMLVPVIGLVQVGFQSMADRYTYVPFIGLSIALVWAIGDLCHGQPMLQRAAIAVGILALAALAVGAYQQTKYWKTSATLYQHALAVTDENYIIQNNLGIILESEGREDEAIALFRQAVAAAPD